ncbi:pyruvate kinase [Lacibacterium aquatile]|uniref:Pyruvate kinase n=1 Tax=Lacibacterium aquatile TaxID=1168082 RepID=A0ABW5DWL2_9PROT
MRRLASTRILATLGPASSSIEKVRALAQAGADVFRLNFSHGSHEDHAARYETVRAVEAELGRPLGILADLQGPKLRISTFAGDKVTLTPGQPFRLDLDVKTPGDATRVGMAHPEIFEAIEPGQDLLLDDGKVRLRIEACGKDFADTRVITGGPLSNRKGVNVPHAVLNLAALTEKDRRDLDFALTLGVDWVALSFVQRADDMAEARKLVQGRAGVLAKLEKPSAIQCLDEIIEMSDALMVARGDLGVEMPPEDVPALQRRIVRACRRAGKPVVVATQMLESMITAPTPTRAEASDVATAVYDGADAVMLSAETASGDWPIEAVSIMNRIILRVESDELYRKLMNADPISHDSSSSDAISAAASQVAESINAAAIVTFTSSGLTALRVAHERPATPILALTQVQATARRLSLVWGMHPVLCRDCTNFEEMVQIACDMARLKGFADPMDKIVVTAGVPFGTPGATNILRVARVEE